jgi:hypothetical protein
MKLYKITIDLNVEVYVLGNTYEEAEKVGLYYGEGIEITCISLIQNNIYTPLDVK